MPLASFDVNELAIDAEIDNDQSNTDLTNNDENDIDSNNEELIANESSENNTLSDFDEINDAGEFDDESILSANSAINSPINIANAINIAQSISKLSNIVDSLNEISSAYNLNLPEIAKALNSFSNEYGSLAPEIGHALSELKDKYNINLPDLATALNTLNNKYNLNIPDIANAISDLNNKYNFNMSDITKAINTLKENNINISDITNAINTLKNDYDLNISDITNALNALKENNIQISDIISAINALEENGIDASNLINTITDPNFNASKIENLLNEILDSLNKKDKEPSDCMFIAPNRVISVANAISGYDYKFILKDKNGTPVANKDVLVIFNGKTQTVKTDATGWGTVTLNGNSAGKYPIVLTFIGDKEYNPTFKTATITLIKEKTTFIAPDRAVYVQQMSRGYMYSAILKDQNGNALANKKVLFIYDGKKTVVTTNEKGWATVTLKGVEAGIKTITIKFAGTASCYYETSTTKTIKIIREPSILNVMDQTFTSSSKTKKVTATLKSKSGNPINGAKVVLTVNGKTYTASTDKLGIAIFSIDLNNIGSFTAVTKFADSRFFVGATAKSRINII